MRNEEIKAELSALRAEVLALAEARKQAESQATLQAQAIEKTEEESEAAAEHEGFLGQVKELVELLEEELKESYLTYAMSVIVGRALPDVRDGLKPVHRRVRRVRRR